MATWLPAAFLSLFSFGVWGLFTKLTVLHIDSRSALIYQTIGVVFIGIVTLSMVNFKPSTDAKGLMYAILTGTAYGIGCLFYFIAASKGKIVTVVTVTALYPLITIILAFLLLKEDVSLRQWIGIVLAMASILLMSV